jgi:seryl-tRNA synthetase
MLDIAFVRQHPRRVKEAAQQKNVDVNIDRLLRLDAQRRALQGDMDRQAQKRHENAQAIAALPQRAEHRRRAEMKKRGRAIKEKLAILEKKLRTVQRAYQALLPAVPHIPTADTPTGADASGNTILRQSGDKPHFAFTPKEHWQLGKNLQLIDNERAAKVSGSRFTYLKGDIALLEFALVQYALSVLTSREALERIRAKATLDVPTTPFIPVIPPALMKPEALHKMARLEPREERYYLERDDLYLIGSAEHSMGAMHMDEILPEQQLPLRYVGFSSAFRREAGSYGKDVHGILRMHQFDKVEMESFTLPEIALREQDFFVAIQETLMQSLRMPYQVVLVCTGDMGAPDARQVDIETWFPGQRRYRETHSADFMTDYQARRLNTKVRRTSGATEFAHMNDATVFAIGRTIAALIENTQREDGSVGIPSVLRPYLGNRETLAAVG